MSNEKRTWEKLDIKEQGKIISFEGGYTSTQCVK